MIRKIRAKGEREAEDRVDRLKPGTTAEVYIDGKLQARVTVPEEKK